METDDELSLKEKFENWDPPMWVVWVFALLIIIGGVTVMKWINDGILFLMDHVKIIIV